MQSNYSICHVQMPCKSLKNAFFFYNTDRIYSINNAKIREFAELSYCLKGASLLYHITSCSLALPSG